MDKINISQLRDIIEQKGIEILTAEQFDRVFQFNNRKKDSSRLSLQLKSPNSLLHEPQHNKGRNATVRIWTDYPDNGGNVGQLAVIGSELYESLQVNPHVDNICVTETIGKGHSKEVTKVRQQRGAVPITPLFVDEPRVATVLWFAADTNTLDTKELVNTFLTAYFKLVKTWI